MQKGKETQKAFPASSCPILPPTLIYLRSAVISPSEWLFRCTLLNNQSPWDPGFHCVPSNPKYSPDPGYHLMGRGVGGLVKVNKTCPRLGKKLLYHQLWASDEN